MKKPTKKSKAAKAKVTKAKVVKAKKASRAATGLGRPDAERTMNPQSTLELKKAKVREIGGRMEYAGRKWVITLKDKHRVDFTSREMAGLTADKLIASINP